MPKASRQKKKNVNKNRVTVLIAAVLLITALIAGIFLFGKFKNDPADETTASTAQPTTQPPATQAEAVKLKNPLTGVAGLGDTAAGQRPIAVVVENAPPARPQWGLCSPDIVIEGVVEGGITRMLWLYADVNTIPKVGPLRSARHDFVEMAEGLNAVFVHWGWSYVAEDAIISRKIDHINGLNGVYFFRDNSRNVDSEHRGYTNGESIATALKDKNINTQVGETYAAPFKFVKENAVRTPGGSACEKVSFAFSSSYKHDFRYNTADKIYYNYMNDDPMLEDGGRQMAVTNVILLYCPVASYDNTILMEMDLTGGSGLYVSNGASETITWKKGNTPTAPLKLYAADGTELQLNPGKSYIGFVPAAQSGSTVIA